jgi:enoyl-[acyl-carrier protein] reductase I
MQIARPVSLAGGKALITGIANDQSIAWGCAQALSLLGADVAITYLNDKARPNVEPLARQLNAIINAARSAGGRATRDDF